MKKILLLILTGYQKVLSPDHSFWGKHRFPNGYCRYYPSCSEYARQTLKQKPLPKAFFFIISRLLRCNPYSKGGFDPVV